MKKLKDKLKTPKDKIDFVIFILHYILLVLAIATLIINLVMIFLQHQDLTKLNKDAIINLLLCISILVSFFTFDKFKEVRKKFLNNKEVSKVVERKEK